MLEQLKMVGISFQSLPVSIREEFALTNIEQQKAPQMLKALFSLKEVVCLSTCNRIEFYYVTEQHIDPLELFFALNPKSETYRNKLSQNIFKYQGDGVVKHIFQVACGLKSLVLGETQILHQLKNAYETSRSQECCGKVLNLLFQYTFKVAKSVHHQTEISCYKRSVSSVAFEFLAQFGDLHDKKVVVVGTGETAKLILKSLETYQVKQVVFVSRTAARANEWAKYSGKSTLLLGQLPNLISNADIIIGCTDSREPIIKKCLLEECLVSREKSRLFLIDLGVPRNFDSSIGEMENVCLRNIDDLKDVIVSNDIKRKELYHHCSAIVEEYVEKFSNKLIIGNLITSIQEDVMQQAEREIDRILQENGDLETCQMHLKNMLEKAIQNPLNRLREMGNKLPKESLLSLHHSNRSFCHQ